MVPQSLCSVDGTLYIPTDKAVDDVKVEQAAPQSDPVQQDHDVLIVDAMGVFQSIKKHRPC